MKLLSVALAAAAGLSAQAADPAPLSLDQAIQQTLAHHPALTAAAARIDAADAAARQAGTAPNPRLAAEVENFAGDGARSGFDAAESTLSLEQPFEGGGKRAARLAETAAARDVAALDREILRLDLTHETTVRFAQAHAAQQRLVFRRQAHASTLTILSAVSNRVAAGKDRPAQQARATAETALAAVELHRAELDARTRSRALTALWSDDAPGSNLAAPPADAVAPSTNTLLAALARAADLGVYEAQLRAAAAAVRAQRAAAAPDWSLGGGVRHHAEDDGVSFIATLGLDLPLRDRRTGAIKAAEALARASDSDRQAAQRERRVALLAAYDAWLAAREAEQLIREAVVPADEEAFAASEAAYASGKAGYLELEDARRALIAGRERLVDAQLELLTTRAGLERLAGTTLTTLAQGNR